MYIVKTVDMNVTQNLRNFEEIQRIGPTPMRLTSWALVRTSSCNHPSHEICLLSFFIIEFIQNLLEQSGSYDSGLDGEGPLSKFRPSVRQTARDSKRRVGKERSQHETALPRMDTWSISENNARHLSTSEIS